MTVPLKVAVLKELYMSLIGLLSDSKNDTQETVEYFSHVTTVENYTKIHKQLGVTSRVSLTGSNVEGCEALQGLWTIVSLNKDGKLHETSPYGSVRLLFPISDVCHKPEDWMLFFEGTYIVYPSQPYMPANQYVRLVLVNKTDETELGWCFNNLFQLDLDDNPFLKVKTKVEHLPGLLALPQASYSTSCVKSVVQRLCLGCGFPVKSCRCPCICRKNQGDYTCNPQRKKTKLKLVVEVFIVNGITLSPDLLPPEMYPTTGFPPTTFPAPGFPPVTYPAMFVDNVAQTGRWTGGIPNYSVAQNYRFFA